MIMKCDLHMNAFSNNRFIITRHLIGSHYPLLVLAHSLLGLVSFAAAQAGVTQCSPPSRVDVYLKPCPH